jgi:transglutaminase-like putative cysteine protease
MDLCRGRDSKVKTKGIPLMLLLLIAIACGCRGQAAQPPADPITEIPTATPTYVTLATIEYEVRESLTVVNNGPGEPSKHNLWLALLRDILPYQTVHSMEITPDEYRLITDEYGNRYAEFDLAGIPPGSSIPIQIQYRITVNELAYNLSRCDGTLPDVFDEAELHIESNNIQIVELAQQLSRGKQTACEQVRAFYDYIGNHLVYSYNGANWGAQAALGEMGADCTEYASLMIALSRASGLPARYVEGLQVLGEESEDDARTEHAWLEVYLPGNGWVPFDPTLGRSSITRDDHFAHLTPDHIIVTVGRNPSTLRGASYWTHLYWPGTSTEIRIQDFEWFFATISD